MDTHFLLILGHIIGTILAVGGATMIEIHLNMALKDGKMDENDRAFLGVDFLITRIGMVIAILTGFGFIFEYYFNNQLFRLENGVFWAKMAILVIILINAYLLDKHKVSLYWGSAFSFVSWWTAMILGTFLTNNIRIVPTDVFISFVTVMAVYGVCVVVSAFFLHKIREAVKAHYQKTHPTPAA